MIQINENKYEAHLNLSNLFFLEGDIVKIHKQSKIRVKPKCSHFKLCGGCNWQNIIYDYQLKYKNDQVRQNLTRIGKIKVDKVLPIVKSDKQYYYRNKMEYSFSNSRWITNEEINRQKEIKNKNALGFHKSGMWSKIIDIDKCYLQENISNKIRNFTKDHSLSLGISFYDLRKQSGDLRNLMIKTTKNKETAEGFKNTADAESFVDTYSDASFDPTFYADGQLSPAIESVMRNAEVGFV